MTWTKLGDDQPDRAWDLSDGAYRLHVAALVYSNRLLTDGLVPKNRLGALVPRFRPGTVRELLALGWWTDAGDSIRIVRDQDDQPTADSLRRRRAATAERVRRWREEHQLPSSGNGVTQAAVTPLLTPPPSPSPSPSPLRR